MVFLYVTDQESNQKINIDELYEKKQRRDLRQVSIFKKILNRIHKRSLSTGKNKMHDRYIWYQIPEYIFGEPLYNCGDCIAYIVYALEENGFRIQYLHPNMLFVSWEDWIPNYVRNEIKKKRGIIIDEKGNVVSETEKKVEENEFKQATTQQPQQQQRQYNSTGNYRPTGNLVYGNDVFDKIEKKII